jgi:hypothetical protein
MQTLVRRSATQDDRRQGLRTNFTREQIQRQIEVAHVSRKVLACRGMTDAPPKTPARLSRSPSVVLPQPRSSWLTITLQNSKSCQTRTFHPSWTSLSSMPLSRRICPALLSVNRRVWLFTVPFPYAHIISRCKISCACIPILLKSASRHAAMTLPARLFLPRRCVVKYNVPSCIDSPSTFAGTMCHELC